jgi:glycosyltransferase involved in cell wall biosynthesis
MKCGVGDYTDRLVNSLKDNTDVEVSVLSSLMEAPIRPFGHPEVHYAMPTWGLKGLRCFMSMMRRIKPDVVHIQFPTQGYASAISALTWIPCICRVLFRVPVVLTWHEYVPRNTPNVLRCMYGMIAGASALVVVRPDYSLTMPKPMRLLLGKAPIRYIPNVSNVPTVTLTADERQTLRDRLGCGLSKIIAHFGFVFPHKGTDLLFQIADPARHHLLLIGELSDRDDYQARVLQLAATPEWKGKVTFTGFVETEKAARLLAVADAVVFPFISGGGLWNTSLHAAACQGTFALVTSVEKNGYDSAANIYYARPQAVDELKQALADYAGVRNPRPIDAKDSWRALAAAHETLYRSLAGVERQNGKR